MLFQKESSRVLSVLAKDLLEEVERTFLWKEKSSLVLNIYRQPPLSSNFSSAWRLPSWHLDLPIYVKGHKGSSTYADQFTCRNVLSVKENGDSTTFVGTMLVETCFSQLQHTCVSGNMIRKTNCPQWSFTIYSVCYSNLDLSVPTGVWHLNTFGISKLPTTILTERQLNKTYFRNYTQCSLINRRAVLEHRIIVFVFLSCATGRAAGFYQRNCSGKLRERKEVLSTLKGRVFCCREHMLDYPTGRLGTSKVYYWSPPKPGVILLTWVEIMKGNQILSYVAINLCFGLAFY